MADKTYKIAVLPGDGTGPEVTVEAVKLLNAAADKFNFKLEMEEYDWDGNRYLRTGCAIDVCPDNILNVLTHSNCTGIRTFQTFH